MYCLAISVIGIDGGLLRGKKSSLEVQVLPRLAQVPARRYELGFLVRWRAEGLHGDVHLRLLQVLGGLELLAVQFRHCRAVLACRPEEVGKRERQPQQPRQSRREVARPQKPHFGYLGRRRTGLRDDARKWMVVAYLVFEEGEQIGHHLRKAVHVRRWARIGQCQGGALVAAGRAPDAQVDATGIEGVERAETAQLP